MANRDETAVSKITPSFLEVIAAKDTSMEDLKGVYSLASKWCRR